MEPRVLLSADVFSAPNWVTGSQQARVADAVAAIQTTGSTDPVFVAGMRSDALAGWTDRVSRSEADVSADLGIADEDFTPATEQSGPVMNLDVFQSDARFLDIDGSGFSVVVLDTGIDLDHSAFGPDLIDNTTGDPTPDGIADRIVFQHDFADNDSNASDVNGHGSNVTSIIASQHASFPGVAPGVNIIHLKVFSNSGGGNFGDVEDALQWVVANTDAYNIAAVNMSLGASQTNWKRWR